MESLVFLIAVIAIFWVVGWALQNEKAPSIEAQKGFFRMKPPAADGQADPSGLGRSPAKED